MKASKFLVVTLAALLPALGSAKMVTYSYPAALSSPEDGRLISATKRKIVHEPLDNVRYSIKTLDGCKERCELKDMGTCTDQLSEFKLVAACGAERGKGVTLNQPNVQKDCAFGEKLLVYLMDPLKTPATVSFEIEITFDDTAPNKKEIYYELGLYPELERALKEKSRKLGEDIARSETRLQEEQEKLRRLEAERDAARLAAAKSTAARKRATAERERAEREYERAVAELQQASAAFNASQRAYDASKRELINSLEAYTAELQSACEQMFQ